MDTNNYYRPSASLIIASKAKDVQNYDCDYKVLLFKRTEKTAFASNHCVFPGGSLEEKADESIEWLSYFKDVGVTWEDFELLEVTVRNNPMPLFSNGRNFSRDISLRITAIRETFEEVGILICLPNSSVKSKTLYGQFKEDFDQRYWQKRVHNNASEFLKLCKKLHVIPDLWSLYEWSVWRSPPSANKKFDTVFYLVILNKQPQLELERSEVEEAMWHNPRALLKLYADKIIWLPPILFYDICRLAHISFLKDLLNSSIRSNKGSTMLMPLYYRCNNGMVGTLSGDDFYPSDPGLINESIIIANSVAEFRELAKRLHRIEITDMYQSYVVTNIPPIDKHIYPQRQNLCKL